MSLLARFAALFAMAAVSALAAPASAAESNEFRIGRQPGIKQKPTSWKEFTFPFIYDRNGS